MSAWFQGHSLGSEMITVVTIILISRKGLIQLKHPKVGTCRRWAKRRDEVKREHSLNVLSDSNPLIFPALGVREFFVVQFFSPSFLHVTVSLLLSLIPASRACDS